MKVLTVDDNFAQFEVNPSNGTSAVPVVPRDLTQGVQSVSGAFGVVVDNTDPANPVVELLPAGAIADVLQLDATLQPVWGPLPTGLSILSFTTPQTLVEAGFTLVNPTFAASYNEAPTSASMIDNQGNPALPLVSPFTSAIYPHSYVSTVVTTVTWILTATRAGFPNAQRGVACSWGFRDYYGAAADPGVITAGFVQGLPLDTLATSRVVPAFTTTIPPGDYLWYCYPASEGLAVLFDVGTGFQTDMTLETSTLPVTNAFGVTVNYTVLRSTFQINATITVRVT